MVIRTDADSSVVVVTFLAAIDNAAHSTDCIFYRKQNTKESNVNRCKADNSENILIFTLAGMKWRLLYPSDGQEKTIRMLNSCPALFCTLPSLLSK